MKEIARSKTQQVQKQVTKPEPQIVERIDEMRLRTSSRFPGSDSEGHQADPKSGGSALGEAREHAQSLTHVGPPLSNRFKPRCELVKQELSCEQRAVQEELTPVRKPIQLADETRDTSPQ